MKKRIKRKIWRWVRRGIFGLTICGLGTGLYFIDHPILALRAESAEANWHEAGLPWTKEFFDREVSEAENAVQLIRQSGMAARGFTYGETNGFKKARDAGQKYRAIYLMAGFDEGLDLLVEASKKEHLYCPGDLDTGEELVIPEHDTLQRGVRLLIERATLDSPRTFDDRLEDFGAVYRLATLVRDEGYGCGPNHYRSICEKLVLGVETLVNSSELNSSELAQLSELTARWSFDVDFGDTVPMMAYQTLVYLRNCPGLVWNEVNLPICIMTTEGAYTPRGEWKNNVHDGIPAGLEKRGLFVRASDYYVALKQTAVSHHGDLRAQGAALDEVRQRHIGSEPQISKLTLGYLDWGGYSGWATHMLETKFMMDALRLAILVKEETESAGVPPDPDLVQLRISDPFASSAPIVNVKDGFLTIYTLGETRKDLGGPDHSKSYPRSNTGIQMKL